MRSFTTSAFVGILLFGIQAAALAQTAANPQTLHLKAIQAPNVKQLSLQPRGQSPVRAAVRRSPAVSAELQAALAAKAPNQAGWTLIDPNPSLSDPSLINLRGSWVLASFPDGTFAAPIDGGEGTPIWQELSPNLKAIRCSRMTVPAAWEYIAPYAQCFGMRTDGKFQSSVWREESSHVINIMASQIINNPSPTRLPTIVGQPAFALTEKHIYDKPDGTKVFLGGNLYSYQLATWDGAQGLLINKRRPVSYIEGNPSTETWSVIGSDAWIKPTFFLFGALHCANNAAMNYDDSEAICTASNSGGDELSLFKTKLVHDVAPAQSFSLVKTIPTTNGGYEKAGVSIAALTGSRYILAARGKDGTLQVASFNALNGTVSPWRDEGGSLIEGGLPACIQSGGVVICVAKAPNHRIWKKVIAPLP